jgi:hypothetical protein
MSDSLHIIVIAWNFMFGLFMIWTVNRMISRPIEHEAGENSDHQSIPRQIPSNNHLRHQPDRRRSALLILMTPFVLMPFVTQFVWLLVAVSFLFPACIVGAVGELLGGRRAAVYWGILGGTILMPASMMLLLRFTLRNVTF